MEPPEMQSADAAGAACRYDDSYDDLLQFGTDGLADIEGEWRSGLQHINFDGIDSALHAVVPQPGWRARRLFRSTVCHNPHPC